MEPIRIGVKTVIIQNQSILLVEYDDASGLHYNLPGGGVEPGESIHQALVREVLEETTAAIEVGRLLIVSEYFPAEYAAAYGPQPKLTLIFEGRLLPGSQPRQPEKPDPNQTGVRWVPLQNLPTTPLLPMFHDLLLQAIRDEYPRALFTTRA